MTADEFLGSGGGGATPLNRAPASALVIGGGICGSTTAAVLAQAGWQVTVLDAAAAHEHHVAAALTPVISSDDNSRAQLSRLGAQLADQYWQSLSGEIGMPCGALQLQRPPDGKRVQDLQAQAQAFNQPDWARWVDCDQASEFAGMTLPRGGIWYPRGWLVRVAKLIEVLQSTVNVSTVHANVQALKRSGSSWLALDASNTVLAQARVAVVANAYDSIGLLKRSGLESSLAACRRLPALHRLAGQVTLIPSDALAGGPRCVVGGNGYVLPAVDNWCVSGGTYERGVELAACTPAGRRANVARAGEILGLEQLPPSDGLPGWAGWRAVLPGRLPAIGALPGSTDLWVFTAGASRGLTWSVLGATLIRNALIGQTSPLGPDLLAQIEL